MPPKPRWSHLLAGLLSLGLVAVGALLLGLALVLMNRSGVTCSVVLVTGCIGTATLVAGGFGCALTWGLDLQDGSALPSTWRPT